MTLIIPVLAGWSASYLRTNALLFLVSLANYLLVVYTGVPFSILSIPDTMLINLIETAIIYVNYA